MKAFMKFMVGLGGGLLIQVGWRRVDFEAALFLSFMDLVYCIIISSSSSTTISPLRDMCVHNWFSLFRVSSTHH